MRTAAITKLNNTHVDNRQSGGSFCRFLPGVARVPKTDYKIRQAACRFFAKAPTAIARPISIC
jgi:hypothetical protein